MHKEALDVPFTPFHWGIALFFYGLLGIWVDPIAMFIGVIIPDIEGILVFFNVFGIQGALHGPLHSPVGIIVDGIIVFFLSTGIWIVLRRLISHPMIKSKPHLIFTLFWSFFAPFSHVLLDLPLYQDISLFWPIIPTNFNPLYGIVSAGLPYLLCTILGVVGLVLISIRFIFYSRRQAKLEER